jgi:hypothetical protein
MIKCKTVDEARAVENVIHIESGQAGVIAYQVGDTLPVYCTPPADDQAPAQPAIGDA